VAALKHRVISSQKPFADATKQTQKIAAASPNAFARVVVDFTNAITVIIARPLALSSSMADGLMMTASGGQVLIGCPLVGVDDCDATSMRHKQRLKCGASGVFAQAQAALSALRSHNPDNRSTLALAARLSTRLVRRPAWRVKPVAVFAAFLASILIEFIRFENDGRTSVR
jgi:nitrous oxidase accessory protein NosD